MSLYSRLKRHGPSGFGYRSSAEQVIARHDLSAKAYLITGCNSGIGLETMRALAGQGATIFGAARTLEKSTRACAAVRGDTRPVACELSSPESVRSCVAELRALDLPLAGIISNAGVMALPRRETCFGIERQLFINHFAHFLLVTELLEQLSDDGRVVALSSGAHRAAPRGGIQFDNLSGERGYSSWRAYGQSKLANLLFARALARRFAGSRRIACAVHPGTIHTKLARHSRLAELGYRIAKPVFLKNIPQGAATQVWAAAVADPALIQGQYLEDCNVSRSSAYGQDLQLAERLWARSEALIATL